MRGEREQRQTSTGRVCVALIAATAALCLAASTAQAEGTLAHPGPCPSSPGEGEWAAVYCARHEITPTTATTRVAEEAAPAAYLHVIVEFSRETQELSREGLTYEEPGETVIEFDSSPLADMTFRSNRGPQVLNAREWPVYLGFPGEDGTAVHILDAELLLKEPTGEATETEAEVPWSNNRVHVEASCEHPDKLYRYTVEARGGSGAMIIKTGQFRLGQHLSAKWCATTRHKEAVATARRRAEERRHYEERVRHERERQAKEDERFVSNCRAIGGIPAVIKGPEGASYIVCHSTTGGVIPVP
jgi:hypothetical protein